MTPPSVARVVWYWPQQMTYPGFNGPLAATIARVVSPTRVNLGYLDEHGDSHSAMNVLLWQEGVGLGERPEYDYCAWPERT